MKDVSSLCVSTLRAVSCAMITKVKSGHPGICLGAAPIVHTLYTKFLNINAKNPNFLNRDRFILSAGHASALLYTINHLAGFNLSVNDLKEFRQKDSNTPGHPEYDLKKGIEITTGPLGQGIASSVGFSIASTYLKEKTNSLIDYNIYTLVGDGDLQEGVCHEALSLAGHLGLENLIILFDSNGIQLDGPTNLCTSCNLKDYLKSLNIEYFLVEDGNSLEMIEDGINRAKSSSFKGPKFIEIKTVIGKYSKFEGTSDVHGKPLSDNDLLDLYKNLDYNYDSFEIDNKVYNYYLDNVIKRGEAKEKEFINKLNNSSDQVKEYINQFITKDFIYDDIEFKMDEFISTRVAVGRILKEYSCKNPFLIGGSADLSSSSMVFGNDGFFLKDHFGRDIRYGVREHAMGAITNGLCLSGFNSFCGGFLVFSDYLRPAIRLSALMNLKSVFLFSHDSVLVGEDGPTHQPLEHLASFRLIPNLHVFRPCDPNEMKYALNLAFSNSFKSGPILISSTRQAVPILNNTSFDGFKKGAYVIYEHSSFDRIIIASGSEVSLAIEVAKKLEKDGIYSRVISMPSTTLFDMQDLEYKNSLILQDKKIVAIELGIKDSYYKYTKNVIGLDSFFKSMPASLMLEELGFDVCSLAKKIKEL